MKPNAFLDVEDKEKGLVKVKDEKVRREEVEVELICKIREESDNGEDTETKQKTSDRQIACNQSHYLFCFWYLPIPKWPPHFLLPHSYPTFHGFLHCKT